MRVHPKLKAYMQWTVQKLNDQETKGSRSPLTVEKLNDQETKESRNPLTEEKLNDQEAKESQSPLTEQRLNDQADKVKGIKRIAQRLNDLVPRAGIRITASLLVALSGLILFADKVTTFGITSTFGFQDSQTFIWALSQSFSPLILILGSCLRPFRIAYTIPGYIYFIQIYWVFHPEIRFDDVFLQIYAIGFVSGFTTLIIVINYMFQGERDEELEYQSSLEHYLDLQKPTVNSVD